MNAVNETMHSRMKAELKALDAEIIEVDGILLKPSQCYRVSTDSGHILFNTNCPDTLKERINAILERYKVHAS
jgi:hypothetical protein